MSSQIQFLVAMTKLSSATFSSLVHHISWSWMQHYWSSDYARIYFSQQSNINYLLHKVLHVHTILFVFSLRPYTQVRIEHSFKAALFKQRTKKQICSSYWCLVVRWSINNCYSISSTLSYLDQFDKYRF